MAKKKNIVEKQLLTLQLLWDEAREFAKAECHHNEPSLFGVTDGKAVGTYLEHKFVSYLIDRYSFASGNSALGIDIPSLGVDIKVTSAKQPQSSCPFKSARQKIFGLGYHLIVFVYEKTDNPRARTSRLTLADAIFIHSEQTADYQTTTGLLAILDRKGNKDDVLAFLEERRLPVDEVEADQIADYILQHRPNQGYLTISNALQWRLQYGRAISHAGSVFGIERIYRHDRS